MNNSTRSLWRTAPFAHIIRFAHLVRFAHIGRFEHLVRFATCGTLLAGLAAPSVFAQDSSGNGLLKGTYRFRYVGVVNETSSGVVNGVTASEGVITFSGNGTYTIATGSQWIDNSKSGVQTIPANSTGTYTISAAGVGTFSNPDPDPNLPGTSLWGTFSQGVITASTTEEGYDSFGDTLPGYTDLFVAIAVGNVPTNSTFTNPYWVGTLDFAAGSDSDVKNALFQIQPNGSGGLGALSIQGWANNANGTLLTQSANGATYNFASDGNAQFSIPAPAGVSSPQVLVSGSRTVYTSNDGNFLLGWTPNGYDIMFGVKALPSNVAGADSLYTGLYYTGGMGDWPTYQGTENCGPYSYWGSQNADGNENEVVHQRLYWPTCANFGDQNGYGLSYDYGTWNFTTMSSTGTATDTPLNLYLPALTYGFGDAGGNCVPSGQTAACAFVAISNTPGEMALNIGVHTPIFSGSGLYLSPVGVVHAASWAPITSSVAPGELITLFGSFGNTPTLISTGGQPFPNFLGTIQVFINGTQAPIYYVSASQISVIAPYELANASAYTAGIQISNGGILSNTVSVELLTDANSGIFSYGPAGDGAQNGIGYAVAEHANGSVISDSNPAQPGETIVMALAGMGTVTPSITDGAVPSTSTLSYVDDFNGCGSPPCYLTVYFHDFDYGVFYQPATIDFAGLYPGLASLYQMNVTVPTTIGPGPDMFVEVVSPYGDTLQVQVPVGGSVNGTGPAVSRRKTAGALGKTGPSPLSSKPKLRLIPVRPRVQIPQPKQQ